MTSCAYDGCSKPVPQHVLDRGGRFCSASCRGADHRERGKTIPARVASCGRTRDGGCYVVVRVSGDFYGKLARMHPGHELDLLERD